MNIACIVTYSIALLCNTAELEANRVDESSISLVPSDLGALPCPDVEDISPCICKAFFHYMMDIDCSGVTNESDLKTIFSKPIPFKDFRKLTIQGNHHLGALHSGDFGNATFTNVFVDSSHIEEVSDGVFVKSESTLEFLHLTRNNISIFPFDELPNYSSLWYMDLSFNDLSSASMEGVSIKSEFLRAIFMDNSEFTQIYSNDFQTPNAIEISMRDSGIQDLDTDSFTKMDDLNYLVLSGNRIGVLNESVIELHGNDSMLFLDGNGIYNVSKGAIRGVSGTIMMDNNLLEVLVEEVWKPMFEIAEGIHLNDNPLLCGCDIAWLILSEEFMDKLEGSEACHDKQRLVDLDPEWYRENCD